MQSQCNLIVVIIINFVIEIYSLILKYDYSITFALLRNAGPSKI